MGLRIALVLAMVAVGAPASAQEGRPEALTRVLDCRSIEDAAARLDCFDREVAAMEQAEAAKDLFVVDRQQLRATRRSLFGLTLPSLGIFGGRDGPEEEEERSIEATVRSAALDPYGNFAVVLDDGSVWRQIDGRVLTVPPRPGHTVTIRKAAMGSYMARVNNQTGVRVRRDR